MTTVQNVFDFLNSIAPVTYKEPWDNVGLLCGRREQPVHRVLVALDPFLNVAQEGAALGADLIVTHHPLMFETKAVTDETPIGQTLLFLIEHHISLICMHTNLDAAPGGVNDCLAARLGLRDVEVLEVSGTDAAGTPYGIGRVGTVDETSLTSFANTVRDALGCTGLRYADAGVPVRRVGICGGAGSGYVQLAKSLGCDTFVTGDVKYNGFWDAVDAGVNLIDAGHFPTENPVCAYLLSKLQAAFPALPVQISPSHREIIHYA